VKRALLILKIGDQLLRRVNRGLIAYRAQNVAIPLNPDIDFDAFLTHNAVPDRATFRTTNK
jgi:hypothetical protein